MPAKEYPVVLRFEGMMPADLAGYEAHRLRKGGDLGHVDHQRSGLNNRLLGAKDWAHQAQLEVNQMAQEAFAAELDYHERRKDQKAIRKRLAEGPRNPWRASRHGPLRELILTANTDWFEQTEDSGQLFDDVKKAVREQEFERLAVSWLQEHFGRDVIHARGDRDEQAYHIHAVIMPRTTVRKYGVECQQIQPSIHPMIRDYEAAQDSVGQHFAQIGLVRGERRKQAIRDALNNGKEPPAKRRHVRPAKWRQQEELRLANEAAKLENKRRNVEAREREVDDVIDYVEALGIDPSDEIGDTAKIKSSPDTQREPIGPGRKAPSGIARARQAFRKTFERLRRRARSEAEEQVASAVEDIKKADQTILEIASQLPKGLRKHIADKRRKLTARIMALDPSSKGRERANDDGRN